MNTKLNYLREYQNQVISSKRVHRNNLVPGDIVKLQYNNEVRLGIVIAPDFDNKLHIISLKVLPPHVFQLIKDTYKTANTITDIDHLSAELYELSKNFTDAYRAYRTYFWKNITHLERVELRIENMSKKRISAKSVDNLIDNIDKLFL